MLVHERCEEEELAMLLRMQSDMEWYLDRIPELMKEYKGEVLAILNGEIISHSVDIDSLIQQLDRKEIDPMDVLVESVPGEEIAYIL